MIKAREFMDEIKMLDAVIKNKRIERQQWLDIALSVTGRMDGEKVQTSGNPKKMENATLNAVDIEREIEEGIVRCQRRKLEIIRVIERLPVAEYDVLHKLYIQGMTIQEAADAKGRTYSNIASIHGQALSDLQRILDQEAGK